MIAIAADLQHDVRKDRRCLFGKLVDPGDQGRAHDQLTLAEQPLDEGIALAVRTRRVILVDAFDSHRAVGSFDDIELHARDG